MDDFKFYYFLVGALVFGVSALMVILEFGLSLNKTQKDNINYHINAWSSERFYFINFAWGVVGGHLFLGSKSPIIPENTVSVIVVAVISLIMIIHGVCFLKEKRISLSTRIFLLLTGFIAGHMLWSMNDYVL
ncbi:MAG: hypothetical protein HKN51_17340 [Saprospiraceae bacterium]|nr:hypothetical protein [Saprospiraceae bacterium]